MRLNQQTLPLAFGRMSAYPLPKSVTPPLDSRSTDAPIMRQVQAVNRRSTKSIVQAVTRGRYLERIVKFTDDERGKHLTAFLYYVTAIPLLKSIRGYGGPAAPSRNYIYEDDVKIIDSLAKAMVDPEKVRKDWVK